MNLDYDRDCNTSLYLNICDTEEGLDDLDVDLESFTGQGIEDRGGYDSRTMPI